MTETKTWFDAAGKIVKSNDPKGVLMILARYDDKGELISEHFFTITKEADAA